MEFISFVDTAGRHWVLNKAFIVGLTPSHGAADWAQGAVLYLDKQAIGTTQISLGPEAVMHVRLALGAAM